MRALLFLAGLAAGVLSAYFLFLPREKKFDRRADLALTARIDSGTLLEIFVNGEFDRSLRANIVPGKLHRYLFPNVPGNIDHMRIDLTEAVNAAVRIDKLELLVDGAPVRTIPAAELRGWPGNHLQPVTTEDSTHLEFVTS